MLQIGVAIVGYGYWGPNLARNFYELSTCRLSAVCDQDVTRLAEAERLYPSALFIKDYQDILSESAINAVIVCTPVHTHYIMAKEALLASKHVLIEKPC